MAKTNAYQFRATDHDKQVMRETQVAGGWASVADMIRDLVKQAAAKQSPRHQPLIVPRQPDHQPDAPQQ